MATCCPIPAWSWKGNHLWYNKFNIIPAEKVCPISPLSLSLSLNFPVINHHLSTVRKVYVSWMVYRYPKHIV